VSLPAQLKPILAGLTLVRIGDLSYPEASGSSFPVWTSVVAIMSAKIVLASGLKLWYNALMMITAARFEQLKQDKSLISCREEEEAFERTLAWEVRSARAKRAAATKRAKYTEWPTRKNSHLRRK
jgi:hypothetical protein